MPGMPGIIYGDLVWVSQIVGTPGRFGTNLLNETHPKQNSKTFPPTSPYIQEESTPLRAVPSLNGSFADTVF